MIASSGLVQVVGRAFNTRPVSIDGETDWLVDGQAFIMPDVFGVTGRIGLRCPRGEPRLRRSWTLRSYASNFTK